MAYTFRQWRIRDDMVSHLQRYARYGGPLGDFLSAVVSNNFVDACSLADDDNQANLPAFAGYLYNKRHGEP
jgi:hypothetical protein